MSSFILIFVCLVLGVWLRSSNKLPPKSHQALNVFIIHVSLPATVLVQIPNLLKTTEVSLSLLVPISMAWITFFLSFVVMSWMGKKLNWGKAETGALILTAGLGNTSFVGFPLLEAMIGKDAIPIGVIVDQLGTFLVLSTLGLVFASMASPRNEGDQKIDLKRLIKNLMVFPPFLALFFSFVGHGFGMFESEFVIEGLNPMLTRLASTLVPIALVGVGLQLRLNRQVILRQKWPLLLGLSFKLCFIPLFFFGLYVGVFEQKGMMVQVTLLESAMASMITAAVVAEEFGFNAEIASLMVGVGIPISILTTWLWNTLVFGPHT